jgi:hypothetical protein
MSSTQIKQNLGRIIRTLQEQDLKLTHIAKSMGYTTTAQLHSSLEGDSLISTKAVIALIKNFKVNPYYLFLGKGEMFQTDESELEKLRKENHELSKNHNEALKTILKLNDTIKALEKRNADLIDLTSAAIKYHKGNPQEEQDSGK